MKLDFVFVAEAANVLDKGTFDVIGGGLDVVTGPRFPATQPVLVLIARVSFDPKEAGSTYEFHAEIASRDGNVIFDGPRGNFKAPAHPRDPTRPNWMTLCMNCRGVTFPAPGDYIFRLLIGNELVAQATIEAFVEEGST